MSGSKRLPEVLLGIHVAACLFCLIGPGYSWWGASVRPYVLGLPFSFAWHVFWIVLTCVVLALFHRAVSAREDL